MYAMSIYWTVRRRKDTSVSDSPRYEVAGTAMEVIVFEQMTYMLEEAEAIAAVLNAMPRYAR